MTTWGPTYHHAKARFFGVCPDVSKFYAFIGFPDPDRWPMNVEQISRKLDMLNGPNYRTIIKAWLILEEDKT